jgi:hypothetical protein
VTRRTIVLVALAACTTAAVVACTLNPQPLPPSDFASENDSDASTRADSGNFGGEDPTPNADGSTGVDAGRQDDSDGGDAGDGGDGGDASDGG